MQTTTPAQMTAVLAVHSARAEPVIPEGWQVPNGYILRGPRGRQGVVFANGDGSVDGGTVRLWCDFIALADAGVAERQRRRVSQ